MATKIVKTLKFPGSSDDYQINAVSSENGIFYVAGGGTTDTTNKVATWTGSNPAITSYYEGLTIAYKVGTAGSTTTTLNINELGAVPVVKNVSTGISTSYDVDSIILLVYTVDGSTARWKIADYDNDVKARTYKTNTNKDYPALFRYDNTNSSSYYAEYTRYDQDMNYTYNPSTGLLKVPKTTTQLTNGITIGSKTYDGSSPITILPTDIGLTPEDLGLNRAMRFIGTTTTALTDGSTTATITIDSSSVTVDSTDAGVVVLYKNSSNKISTEFVWDGTAWRKLGDEGSFSLKTHTHTVTHTPAGTVSKPTFTGTEAGHTHSFSGSASHNHSFTGTGTLIKGTFSGTEQTASVSYTPAGTVSKPTITVTPNTSTVNSITAVGTLPSLSYTADTASEITAWNPGALPSLTYSEVEASKITAWSAGSGSASLTGTVTSSGPNRTVTLTLSHSHTAPSLTYSTVKPDNITAWSAGTLPSLSYDSVDVDNITAWSAGTLPTKGSNTTVVTSIKSATSSQPTFTGTAATISHKHTPSGTITITTGTPGTGETANYTPSGTVGNKSVTISGTTGETKVTPSGTVSQPTFTGTAATLTTAAANS